MTATQTMLLKVYNYAYKLKADGKTSEQIKTELLAYGIDARSSVIIAQTIDKSYNEIKIRARNKNLLLGLLWCTVGVALAMLTHYNNLHNSGFPYLIACVALFFSVIRFLVAFFNIK